LRILNQFFTYLLYVPIYARLGIRSFPGWLLSRMVFFPERRFPESRFPDDHFPGKMIPGWSLSRKDVSRVVIFPDDWMRHFPERLREYRMVGLMFNCSWRWSLTDRPHCVCLNGFTVNSPH